MQVQQLQIPTPSGTMETFVVRPDQAAPLAIVYMDVWGIREELIGIAWDLATAGYCAVVPDLYYRLGRVRHEFRGADGKMITLARLSPEQQEQVRVPLRTLSAGSVMADTEALIGFADRELGTAGRPVGAVGYCMGGRFALLAFGRFLDRVRAVASLHGTDLATEAKPSPHRIAAKGQGEIYCGFAEHDPHGAPEVVASLAAELHRPGVSYRYQVHQGAEHGYALPDRDIHDAGATAKDWDAIRTMLRRQLMTDASAAA